MSFNYPLNINNFTLTDRLKIGWFLLNSKNRWTQDSQVKKIEEEFAKFVGAKYAVFVSSGSTANTLLAMYLKDTTEVERNIVVLPSLTWATSVSPFIREGFTPVFLDISFKDMSLSLYKLERYLKENHKKVAAVFITSLLGFAPDIQKIQRLSDLYKVKIMLDNCESTLTQDSQGCNLSGQFTSTTSTYFGHNIQSIEGGFIFTNIDREYEYFIMGRNHGMTRGLDYGVKSKYRNFEVDSRFDFCLLGNNFRNTDLNAFIGLLDFKRRYHYIQRRKELYKVFQETLDKDKFILPEYKEGDVPFSLPIIANESDCCLRAKQFCLRKKIETRPIISGFLGYQKAFKPFFNKSNSFSKEYKNAIKFDNCGFYIGLYSKLENCKIQQIAKEINKL